MNLFTNVDIDCNHLLLDSGDVVSNTRDISPLLQYLTVNEISAEARELIASWERNYVRPVDYDPSHSPEQLRTRWAAVGVQSIADMPPPMRFRRRMPKFAFIG